MTIVTLNGNAARFGGGTYELSQFPTQTLTLANTIIAFGSVGGDCYVDPSSQSAITSNGYNLSNDGTCAP